MDELSYSVHGRRLHCVLRRCVIGEVCLLCVSAFGQTETHGMRLQVNLQGVCVWGLCKRAGNFLQLQTTSIPLVYAWPVIIFRSWRTSTS